MSSTPVPSPGIRQHVSGRASSMLAATYVVRLPKASVLGGAARGAAAVAVLATSTGSPAGSVAEGVSLAGVAEDDTGDGAGSLLVGCTGADEDGTRVGSTADGSSSPEVSSSHTPPTATSTITSA